MPKRLRDNPLDQDQSKTKRYYDKDLRPFFERTAEEHSRIRDPAQLAQIKKQEKLSNSAYQPLKAYGINVDEFYIDDHDEDDEKEDSDYLY